MLRGWDNEWKIVMKKLYGYIAAGSESGGQLHECAAGCERGGGAICWIRMLRVWDNEWKMHSCIVGNEKMVQLLSCCHQFPFAEL